MKPLIIAFFAILILLSACTSQPSQESTPEDTQEKEPHAQQETTASITVAP